MMILIAEGFGLRNQSWQNGEWLPTNIARYNPKVGANTGEGVVRRPRAGETHDTANMGGALSRM